MLMSSCPRVLLGLDDSRSRGSSAPRANLWGAILDGELALCAAGEGCPGRHPLTPKSRPGKMGGALRQRVVVLAAGARAGRLRPQSKSATGASAGRRQQRMAQNVRLIAIHRPPEGAGVVYCSNPPQPRIEISHRPPERWVAVAPRYRIVATWRLGAGVRRPVVRRRRLLPAGGPRRRLRASSGRRSRSARPRRPQPPGCSPCPAYDRWPRVGPGAWLGRGVVPGGRGRFPAGRRAADHDPSLTLRDRGSARKGVRCDG